MKRTPEGCATARRLISEGKTLTAIAELLGIHPSMVRCWADPEYAHQRNLPKLSPTRRVQKLKWTCSVPYEDYVANHPSVRISLPYVRCLEGKEAPTFRMVR